MGIETKPPKGTYGKDGLGGEAKLEFSPWDHRHPTPVIWLLENEGQDPNKFDLPYNCNGLAFDPFTKRLWGLTSTGTWLHLQETIVIPVNTSDVTFTGTIS